MEQNSASLKNFRDSYKSLNESEKRALQMGSIICESFSKTKLADCLRDWGFRDEEGKAVSSKTAKVIFDALETRGLIVCSGKGFKCCELLASEITLDACNDGVFDSMLAAIRKVFRLDSNYYGFQPPLERLIREVRAAVYKKDFGEFKTSLEVLYEEYPKINIKKIFNLIFNSPFQPEWFKSLPLYIQASALSEMVGDCISRLEPFDNVLPILEMYQDNSDNDYGSYFRDLSLTVYILQGKFEQAKTIADKERHNVSGMSRLGCVDFLTGANDEAIAKFSKALEMLKKNSRKRVVYFSNISGVFYILALIKSGNSSHHAEILKYINHVMKTGGSNLSTYDCLRALMLAMENVMADAKRALLECGTIKTEFLFSIVYSFTALWFFPDMASMQKPALIELYKKAVKNKYEWIAMELAGILALICPEEKEYGIYADEIKEKTGAESILGIIKFEQPWERSLRALERINVKDSQKQGTSSRSRLVWFITENGSEFSPKEQLLGAKGGWTRGRPVALERLAKGKLDCMTAQDHEIAKAIRKMEYSAYRYYSESYYGFDYSKGIIALAGHPLIFLEESPGTGVELLKAEPELLVEQKGEEFEVRFSRDFEPEGVCVFKESPTRFTVFEVTEAYRKIMGVLGRKSLKVPATAKDRILGAIKNLTSVVTVHSDIDGRSGDIPTVEANSKTTVHLLPIGDGIKLEMFVKPFQQGGPYFKPGSGGVNVFAVIDGNRVQAQRDLKLEAAKSFEVIDACPSLAELDSVSDDMLFERPEDCLQVLAELQELGDKIALEWPEGERLKVSKQASFDQLRMSIQKENDWFSISGDLKVDESLTIDIKKLLELVETSTGNFVPIGDGFFLSLTKEFRKRAQELAALSETTKKGVRFHPVASFAFQDFAENLEDLECDDNWSEQVNRLKKARQFKPKLPSTLQAELRDYQIDGFNWLARLANWGVGACLADDMGLGKTLQTLALMLVRAKKGPALVVAPSSVCFNWVNEAVRFAPTLKVEFFGGKDREKTLKKLKAFDLLVCSYGLLQTESDKLAEVKWATIALDEAQAIKNYSTKRSKAAMKLQGDFRMITTGTPIENHLGELWNLFRFINPGLLGSIERFNRVFAGPIEKRKDHETKNRLKSVIQPFILRRLKSQVLEELPPKTEITLTVEFSTEEASFYEALRQKSLEKLASMDGVAGENRLQILAEIMKLRRACCHSRLVAPDSPITSSKLALFAEVVEELIDNRHKVLVFSQFVGHLSIIRKQVEKMGISYQYLDGSTPMKERKRSVDAFQAGEGDLFLISLKAGGLGLNLTVADYVIHMDPWWNPAVEDQASDRAHRIGQQRPVTIYRFVTKDAIEEKIVQLHGEKRNLADSLLEGAESTGKISADQLLRLIREN